MTVRPPSVAIHNNVADTVRSHLHAKGASCAEARGPYCKPEDDTLCRWFAAWSTRAQPTAIVGSRLWPTGNAPERASRSSVTSASSGSCARTAFCPPGTRAARPVASVLASSSSCARTCAGVQMASRSVAGTETSSGSTHYIDAHDRERSHGMLSSDRVSGGMIRHMLLEAVESGSASSSRRRRNSDHMSSGLDLGRPGIEVSRRLTALIGGERH